ncbi:hypothetical protein KO02_12090 [Sphingobacterium sp. ML3W]|uniref:hypothetical protein n=1 Tax=Sphingobacterium sp. ML3W TaxID=1538644 RepID=UPI0004F897F3|nr:hypothetical protein [Sphingobacterium sp. ML3W]AIM37350.1 hypothetical protein KO02_12090 [Sphingobacterium sp. ML3W]
MDIQNIHQILKDQQIITEDDLAIALEITKTTLRRYRNQADNPLKHSKIGTKKIMYTRNHIIEFIVENMVNITKKEKTELKQQLINDYK